MDKSRSHKRPYLNLLVIVAAILLISFIIIMFNQILQLIQTASAVHQVLGRVLIVFFSLLGIIAALALIGIMAKLKRPLTIPDEDNLEEYSKYVGKLKIRLMKNRYLKKIGYQWDPAETDIEAVRDALGHLDMESLRIIKEESAAVFLTTAVSQNGSLDSVFMFVSASKLVWKIATLYNQKPAIGDLVMLYANVFGTVLMSREIEDLDLISDQLEPIITPLLGGTLLSIIPGTGYAVSFVVDSIIEGSINTLLMLRIGIISQQYCGSTVRVNRKIVKRYATVQASKLLGSLIKDNSQRIVVQMKKAFRNMSPSKFGKSM